MRRQWMTLLVFVFVGVGLILFWLRPPATLLQVGDVVVPVTLLDEKGDLHRIPDPHKVYLINFWATWCGPCVGEMPSLNALYQRYKEKGLVVLGVNRDGGDAPALVAALRRSVAILFPVLYDADKVAVQTFGQKSPSGGATITTIPFSILIGKNGQVIYQVF